MDFADDWMDIKNKNVYSGASTGGQGDKRERKENEAKRVWQSKELQSRRSVVGKT